MTQTLAEKYGEAVGQIISQKIDTTVKNLMRSFGFATVEQMMLAGYEIIIQHGPRQIRVKIAKVEKESIIRF